MRPQLPATVIAATAALALAACAQGQRTEEEAEGVDFGAEPGDRFSIMGFGLGDEIAQVRYDRAIEPLGDIDISLSEGELDIQAFLSRVASGNPPDVVYANRDQIGTFASRGAILPLDECVEAHDIDVDAYRDAALAQVTFADQVYGIPEFNQVQVTMANPDLLQKAGYGVEDVNGSDREAIEAVTKAVMKEDGGKLSVIGYDSKLPEFLPLWAKSAGRDLLSEDGRTAQLDDPDVVEALEFAVGIYDMQGGFPAVKTFRESADFFGAGNQFASGTLGAMPMEQWYINVLNEASPDAPLAFDAFRGPDGQAIAFATGSAWAIPSGAANPQAACAFVKAMTETEAWMAAAEARAKDREKSGLVFTGVLTGNEEADQRIRDELVDPGTPQPWSDAITAMYEANDGTFTLPANPADNEFKTAWQDAVNRVLNGQQQPAEALAQAQQEAQAALDEAWAAWDEGSS